MDSSPASAEHPSAPVFSAVFTDSVTSYDYLMITIQPEWSTSSSRPLQIGDDLMTDHAFARRASSRQDFRQINLALEDVSTLCQDKRGKVAIVAQRPHGIKLEDETKKNTRIQFLLQNSGNQIGLRN